jgi:hypothetical protein
MDSEHGLRSRNKVLVVTGGLVVCGEVLWER